MSQGKTLQQSCGLTMIKSNQDGEDHDQPKTTKKNVFVHTVISSKAKMLPGCIECSFCKNLKIKERSEYETEGRRHVDPLCRCNCVKKAYR